MSEKTKDERPCPGCIHSGHGLSRIGNRRATCKVCNSFARRLDRAVTAELKQMHLSTYTSLRSRTEERLYAELMKGRP